MKLSIVFHLAGLYDTAVAGSGREVECLHIRHEPQGVAGVRGSSHLHHPAADVAAGHGGDHVVHGAGAREPRDPVRQQDHTLEGGAWEELDAQGARTNHALQSHVSRGHTPRHTLLENACETRCLEQLPLVSSEGN